MKAITYIAAAAIGTVAVSHPGGVIHIEARDWGMIVRPIYDAAEVERALDYRIVLGEPFQTIELGISATGASALVTGVASIGAG